ncbi:MAG: energy-coupling factor transporter ATPase [Clostridia bacterium]|nr:energy-coupling factor transporter ATPase [Clostridia bacterium]
MDQSDIQNFIEMNHVSYSYHQNSQDPLIAVNDISLHISRGNHIAILGRNGSGKSTLARLINALEQPEKGVVLVAGMNTVQDENIWEIRRLCGMVFQNPDNQIIGTTVEEDVAFGPENLGFPQPEIRKAVDEALAYVGLSEEAQKPPHLLSGGQKQKLAIAGILAMKPACLILDEATSMLDPISRQEFMQLIEDLVQNRGMTIVNITHHMEEVLMAQWTCVMSAGRIATYGTPAEVFDQVDLVRREGLDVPTHTEIAHEVSLLLEQPLYPMEAAEWDGAQKAVLRLLQEARNKIKTNGWQPCIPPWPQKEYNEDAPVIISVRDLSYTYAPGTILATEALSQVSFDVKKGELFGIIGHTGSGKSTLIQHLNGLIRGPKGSVIVLGMDASVSADIKKIRQRVGLLFQYPEHQLFEETVFQDIAFGPKQMGLDMNEIEARVLKAAQIVGLTNEELDRSPFELSGGEKRRAAIAGVLAMEPEILILDEPAAGLDPAGRDEFLGYADRLRSMGVTVILVSHSMEDIARLADRVLVLRHGKVHAYGKTADVFRDETILKAAGLSLPRTTAFLRDLQKIIPNLDDQCYEPELAARKIIEAGLCDCLKDGKDVLTC